MPNLGQIVDQLQWAFDGAYGLISRPLKAESVNPLLIGHRGVFCHPEIKENTVRAFDLAISRGAAIEFDLHLTKDLVPVVHHDQTLHRVHNMPYAISSLSLAELKEVAPEVPTLDFVLDRYLDSCPRYFIEPKVQDVEDVDRLLTKIGFSLKSKNLMEKATLLSTSTAVLDRARLLVPQLEKVIVFFVDYRSCQEYVLRSGDTGLAGWYFTFPESMRSFLEDRRLHAGIGQIDYANTHKHFCNRNFRYQFTNRVDRLVPLSASLSLPGAKPPAKILALKNSV